MAEYLNNIDLYFVGKQASETGRLNLSNDKRYKWIVPDELTFGIVPVTGQTLPFSKTLLYDKAF